MCSGSYNGSIRVWRLDTLEEQCVMLNEDCVYSLAVWEGQLISGHVDGARVGCEHWRTAAGAGRQHWGCSFALHCGVAPGERIDRHVDQGVGDGSGARVAVREDADGAHR